MGIEALVVKDETILASERMTEPTRIEGTVKRTHAIRVATNGEQVATRGDQRRPLVRSTSARGPASLASAQQPRR